MTQLYDKPDTLDSVLSDDKLKMLARSMVEVRDTHTHTHTRARTHTHAAPYVLSAMRCHAKSALP